jgi:hypothetical protein
LAVLRLNLVGCTIGWSPGFALFLSDRNKLGAPVVKPLGHVESHAAPAEGLESAAHESCDRLRDGREQREEGDED